MRRPHIISIIIHIVLCFMRWFLDLWEISEKAANSVSEYLHRQHSTIGNLPVLPELACRPYFRDISACNLLIHLVRDLRGKWNRTADINITIVRLVPRYLFVLRTVQLCSFGAKLDLLPSTKFKWYNVKKTGNFLLEFALEVVLPRVKARR